MTFDQFRASGHDADDIGAALQDDTLTGVKGRVYFGRYYIARRESGDGWFMLIGNQEYQSGSRTLLEWALYGFACNEGAFQP